MAAPSTNCDKEKEACKIVIQRCDAALEAKDKAISDGQEALKQCSLSNQNLAKDDQSKTDSLNSWYRNPVLTVLIGIFTGLVAGFVVGYRTK